MMLGLGLGLPALAAWQTLKGWTPAALFTPGTAGFCGGMSVTEAFDAGLMFQDSTGTTPAALEQPVGLVLGQDQGAGLGTERVTNGDFSDGTTGWSASNAGATISVVSGGLKVEALADSTSDGAKTLVSGMVIGKPYLLTLDYTHVGNVNAYMYINAFAGLAGQGGYNTSQSLQFYFVATGTADNLTIRLAGAPVTGDYFLIDNISVREVLSVPAYQTTSTKRPTLKDDGSGHLYLEFDGTDDCLVTPSIDLTGTDKVTVFAGVRKLPSTPIAICEFSADPDAGDGRFAVYSGYPVANDYSFYAHGAGGVNGASFARIVAAPPDSAVLSGTSDLLAQVNTISRNGVAGTNSTPTWTPTMFANESLFIGSRNQSGIFFNGRMYTLPIVVGRAVEPALIAEVEAHINAAMGGIY